MGLEMFRRKKPPMSVVFEPGCFDDIDLSATDIAELVAEIHRLNETGELMSKAQPLTEEDEELLEKILDKRKERH